MKQSKRNTMTLHQKTKRKQKSPAALSEPIITPPVEEAPAMRRTWKQRLWRWIWHTVVILCIGVVLVLFGIYLAQPRYYKLLIIGSDQRNHEHARSDVLMILAVPKSSRDSISLTTIPRDTKVDHATKGLQKITHFYAMWEDPKETLGNRVLTESVVEDVLHTKVHGTIEVTFESFDQVVDLLGGVDTSQGHLNGKQAEELVHNRFVQPNGDFGRTAAQREIVENILSKMKHPSNAYAVYDYFQHTQRARLTTNRVSSGLFAVAYFLGHRGHISFSQAKEVILPGTGELIYTPAFNKKLYYWVLDDAKVKELVQQYLQ